MDRAFYFETFSITQNTNGTYNFTAKSNVEITSLGDRTPVAGVITGREMKFDISDETKGQDFMCDNIDFSDYIPYDLLKIVLTTNGEDRDEKCSLVIKKNTKYPPPNSERLEKFLNDRMKPAKSLKSLDLNERFELTRLYGKRISDKVYGLEFKITDSLTEEYVFADYRAVYDEYNFIVAIVLFVKRPEDPQANPPEKNINFKLNTGYKKFKPTGLVPILVAEKKNDNYLNIVWKDVDNILACISFD